MTTTLAPPAGIYSPLFIVGIGLIVVGRWYLTWIAWDAICGRLWSWQGETAGISDKRLFRRAVWLISMLVILEAAVVAHGMLLLLSKLKEAL